LGLIGAIALLALFGAPRAVAFDARNGDEVTIPAGQTVNDDLYIAAQTVTINGTVQGDVVAAGQIVTINGTIEGGLIAVAQTLIINGTVRDTARVAAQAIVLDPQARIGRDLMVGAYSLETRPGSAVGRDTLIGAYQALLTGTIGRNLAGGLAGLDIRSSIGGDVNVAVGA
jgi:cytoskeletal protein CcmA (bactofilin family)